MKRLVPCKHNIGQGHGRTTLQKNLNHSQEYELAKSGIETFSPQLKLLYNTIYELVACDRVKQCLCIHHKYSFVTRVFAWKMETYSWKVFSHVLWKTGKLQLILSSNFSGSFAINISKYLKESIVFMLALDSKESPTSGFTCVHTVCAVIQETGNGVSYLKSPHSPFC